MCYVLVGRLVYIVPWEKWETFRNLEKNVWERQGITIEFLINKSVLTHIKSCCIWYVEIIKPDR